MTVIQPRLMPSALMLVVFSVCVPLFAQTETGRILGSVSDQSQAVVVGAAVSITDTQRGQTRNLTTNDAGEYPVPNLLPGVYVVRATAQGFKNVERRNVELQFASDVRIDFVLQPGDTQTTVTISEEAPLVDSTSSVLGGTLTNQQI
jgi:carboxypeptidase family protein